MRMTFFLIFCFISSIFAFLYYMGVMTEFHYTHVVFPDSVFVFEKVQGDYKKIDAEIEELSDWLITNGVTVGPRFRIYFDNPSMVEKGRLRSIAGYLLLEKDHHHIEQISKKFHVQHLVATDAVTTELVYRNFLSRKVGHWKLFSIKANIFPIIEIQKEQKIQYYFFPKKFDFLFKEFYLIF